MKLAEWQKQRIRELSVLAAPEEACGFVLEHGDVTRTLNVAADPCGTFEIDTQAFLLAEEAGLRAIWHSHSSLDGLSPADQAGVIETGLPWIVYTLATDRFHLVDPADRGPLLGRSFCYGINDCYSLVCDALRERHGVELPAWRRGAWGEWDDPSFTVFDEQVARHCRQLGREPMLAGDVLLFGARGRTGHIGVATGPEHFLHHLAGEESREEFYGEAWQRRTTGIWRPRQAQPRWAA